jgi:hypothetical protein
MVRVGVLVKGMITYTLLVSLFDPLPVTFESPILLRLGIINPFLAYHLKTWISSAHCHLTPGITRRDGRLNCGRLADEIDSDSRSGACRCYAPAA